MSFLCPGKLVKWKKSKESLEEADGQGAHASTDLSRYSPMVVKHTFVSCRDDELPVKQGQIVTYLDQEGQWIHATDASNRCGFVPSSYLAPISAKEYALSTNSLKASKRRSSKKLPFETYREESNRPKPLSEQSPAYSEDSLPFGESALSDLDLFRYGSDVSLERSYSAESIAYSDTSLVIDNFVKKPHGRYLVLHSYHGEGENDATVLKGDCVTVMNRDDKDWYWVLTSDDKEGFVPRSNLWQATCEPEEKL